jgi:hypothetical protein
MKARQWTMWHRVWSMMGCGGVGLLLLAGMAGAQSLPPFPGGLPECLAQLQTCTQALTDEQGQHNMCKSERDTCKTDLATCQMDLEDCQETNAALPGDGAGHGPNLSYTPNSNGTATDQITLLVWEVKDNNDGVHDVDNIYTWSLAGCLPQGPCPPNGTLFTEFLHTLNNTCEVDEATACTSNTDCAEIGGNCGYAGFRDWRIPHVKELQSIVDYGQRNPSIDPTFPGLTAVNTDPDVIVGTNYWSITEDQGVENSTRAWVVGFTDGDVILVVKPAVQTKARAVRGGQ